MYRGSLEKRQKHKKCDLVFSPSRSNLGLVSSRFAGFVRNREILNLGMVSTKEEKKLAFHEKVKFVGLKKTKKNEK